MLIIIVIIIIIVIVIIIIIIIIIIVIIVIIIIISNNNNNPRQLGYGTPHGCEAVLHAVRMYLHYLSPDNAILKLDYSNAFNSIRCDIKLKAVEDLAPDLVRFVHSVYSAPSTLFWEDECLLSCEGSSRGILWVPCCSALLFTSCLSS